jgi:hypothetical protein
VGGPEGAALPRGRRGTEPVSRTIHDIVVSEGLGPKGPCSKIMRCLSGPGVLETLNPTDDGHLGNDRNTYET